MREAGAGRFPVADGILKHIVPTRATNATGASHFQTRVIDHATARALAFS